MKVGVILFLLFAVGCPVYCKNELESWTNFPSNEYLNILDKGLNAFLEDPELKLKVPKALEAGVEALQYLRKLWENFKSFVISSPDQKVKIKHEVLLVAVLGEYARVKSFWRTIRDSQLFQGKKFDSTANSIENNLSFLAYQIEEFAEGLNEFENLKEQEKQRYHEIKIDQRNQIRARISEIKRSIGNLRAEVDGREIKLKEGISKNTEILELGSILSIPAGAIGLYFAWCNPVFAIPVGVVAISSLVIGGKYEDQLLEATGQLKGLEKKWDRIIQLEKKLAVHEQTFLSALQKFNNYKSY